MKKLILPLFAVAALSLSPTVTMAQDTTTTTTTVHHDRVEPGPGVTVGVPGVVGVHVGGPSVETGCTTKRTTTTDHETGESASVSRSNC